jgi:hypothetical protein
MELSISGCGVPCASPDRPTRWIARQNTKPKNLHPTSTRHNVANMDLIDEAIAVIESLDEGENFTYTAIAD